MRYNYEQLSKNKNDKNKQENNLIDWTKKKQKLFRFRKIYWVNWFEQQ